jgi:hypothetical protein
VIVSRRCPAVLKSLHRRSAARPATPLVA